MKFTTTTNTTYRKGVGTVPRSWIEYLDKNHIDSVYEYFDKNIKFGIGMYVATKHMTLCLTTEKHSASNTVGGLTCGLKTMKAT